MARRWSPSIRFRAVVAGLVVAVLILGLGALGARLAVEAGAENEALAVAQRQAMTIADSVALVGQSDVSLALHQGRLADLGLDQTKARYLSWIFTADQYVVDSGGLLEGIPLGSVQLPSSVDSQAPVTVTSGVTVGPAGGCNPVLCGRQLTFVGLGVPGLTGASPLAVFILVSPFAVRDALAFFDRWPLLGVPLGGALVAVIVWWVVRRVLSPVEAIRAELSDITAHDLGRRVPVPRSRDVIHRLAVTTNETLARLEAAADRERRFVADAAHELRSPLACLINTLEVSAAHPDRADWPRAVDTALAEARRLRSLTDDLLLLARLDRALAPPQRVVDLDALVTEQVAERQFGPAGPRFTLTAPDPGPPVQVTGDEGQLGRLLRNLLDNAATYAATTVAVALNRGPGHVDLEVVDDGPGIARGDRERVFERFTRLDAARERRRGGAGLGLAIARDIATQHGATIAIADSPTGTRVLVRLPTTASTAEGHCGQTREVVWTGQP